VDGPVDQVAAVVEDVDVDAFRQGGGELVELGLYAGDHLAGIRPAQSEDQPLDGLALAVLGHRPVAGQAADLYVGDVGDVYGGPARRGRHNDFAQVVQLRDASLDADQQGLLAVAKATSAVVLVVAREGVAQLSEGDTTGAHLRHVG